MKAFKVVYKANGIDTEMVVHAQSVSEARSTATTLLSGKNASIMGIVESSDLIEHKNILLCEEVGH